MPVLTRSQTKKYLERFANEYNVANSNCENINAPNLSLKYETSPVGQILQVTGKRVVDGGIIVTFFDENNNILEGYIPVWPPRVPDNFIGKTFTATIAEVSYH